MQIILSGVQEYFSHTFPVILTEYVKPEKINFLRTVFTQNMTAPVCLSGPKTVVKLLTYFAPIKQPEKAI